MKRKSKQKGLETLEFVGLFPLVILTILIVWQLMLVGYTAIVAAGAAREGARAAAVGKPAEPAAKKASMGLDCECNSWISDDTVVVRCGIRVRKVPGLPFENIHYPRIYSTAIMRCERPYR